ncbi:MAG TPA: PQQ-binding-like beta-propeller repeat protein, partial [Gemmataceae bacterium]
MRIIARRGVPAAVALAVLAAAARAGDWPQILGPARDGHSPERGLRTDWPAGGPPRAWETAVGAGFSGPAVAGGKLVLFHRLGNDEVVACLDAATGKELWRSAYRTGYRDDFGFDEGPRATPLIAGGRVFTLGADGELAAHEMASGKRLWRRNVREDYNAPKGYFGVACSPLLAGGRLLVNVGAPGAGIVAFDPATGKELWRATDDPAGYSSPAAATIRGRPHAVFLTRTGLVSLDPADGKVYFTKRWRARLAASVNAATPLVRGDRIFLSASYQTGAVLLEVGDGNRLKEVWSGDEMLSNHYNTSLLCGDFLYG